MKLILHSMAPVILGVSLSFLFPWNSGRNSSPPENLTSAVASERREDSTAFGIFLRFSAPAPAWFEEDLEEAPPGLTPEQDGRVIEAGDLGFVRNA